MAQMPGAELFNRRHAALSRFMRERHVQIDTMMYIYNELAYEGFNAARRPTRWLRVRHVTGNLRARESSDMRATYFSMLYI